MTLTDRYVAAVVRHLPANQHQEVDADVRSLIADAMEARGADGTKHKKPDSLETKVLEELGHPARLASKYAERPMYLIGPDHYFVWRRLVTLLIAIVAPIVAIVAGVSSWLAEESVMSILGDVIGAAFVTTMGIAFWVTLVFAILEHRGVSIPEDGEWHVSELPEPRNATVKLSESIIEVAVLLAVGALLVWQAGASAGNPAFGLSVPVINPALPAYVLPAIGLLIALEVVTIIVRQARGHWTMGDWWANVALNVGSIVIVAPVFAAGEFLNPAAFAEIGWPDAASTVSLLQVQQLIALVIVVSAVIDIAVSYRKARSDRTAA